MIDPEEIDEQDDSILWFQQGIPEAFKLFFFQYYPELFTFAVTLVGDRLAAQKVSMDAFFLCWERREGFTSDQKIRSFLFLAVRNNSLDYLRESALPENAGKPVTTPEAPASLPAYMVEDIYAFAAVGLRRR